MNSIDSIKYRLKLKQVLWIAFAWFLLGGLDAIFLHAVSDNVYIQRTEAYRFLPVLMAYSIGFGIGGFFVGALLLFYMKDRFRDKSYAYFLFINASLILAISIAMNMFGYHIYFATQFDKPFFHPDVWEGTFRIFLNPINLKNLAFGLLLSLGTVIAIQVNDKYGPGIFFNLLIGKYHQPKEEERIFMFLDMAASTTIAEQIGHLQFHNLLGAFFRDITDPIIYRKGEINQYVGDEIIVSWKMENGLKDTNCIRCFFDIQQAILERKKAYLHEYGLVPEFKAGLHFGKVTVGEIGIVKKDIVYSGDVLNSTARIQAKCNEQGVSILLSEALFQKLNLSGQEFNWQKAGAFELKGKAEKMILYAVFLKN